MGFGPGSGLASCSALCQSEQTEEEPVHMMALPIERRPSMDQKEFNELHASCVSAFKNYAAEAEITATMLATCTAEPMPVPKRLKVALQERVENTAHSVYLAAKLLLHEAARLGYAFTS